MTTLIADLVAQQQKGEEPGQHTIEQAKQLLAQLLLPKQITGKLIEKYIKKAMRTGAWRKLPSQTKALLYIAKKIPRFKSRPIKKLLHEIMLIIELQTFKGKALYFGIIICIRKNILGINKVSDYSSTLLFIGTSFINNPLQYTKVP